MNSVEQEALYWSVAGRWPKWRSAKCSGYVHGVVDEGRMAKPDNMFLGRYDDYARGYILGFMDARGEDVRTEEWFRTRFLSEYFVKTPVLFQWWLK